MKVIHARNAHEALHKGLQYMAVHGIARESRNGPVLVAPVPVVTVYQRPTERVVFWPERDANPWLHLMEALWMIGGRQDVAFPAYFAKQMLEYSDDGKLLHGAYGFRWRHHFGFDQLDDIITTLRRDRTNRRQVLQIWDAKVDLRRDWGKDLPCNLVMVFQVNAEDTLDATVFCRSNDILWGAYGANAVHFSILLEFVARRARVPIGRLYQVSTNWHAYDNDLYRRVSGIVGLPMYDPYNVPPGASRVAPYPLMQWPNEEWDDQLAEFLAGGEALPGSDPFFRDVAQPMLRTIQAYKETDKPEAFAAAKKELSGCLASDWKMAAREWIERREVRYNEEER